MHSTHNSTLVHDFLRCNGRNFQPNSRFKVSRVSRVRVRVRVRWRTERLVEYATTVMQCV